MRFYNLDELDCLKDSEILQAKIQEITAFVKDKGFSVEELPLHDFSYKDGKLTFSLSLSIPFLQQLSFGQSLKQDRCNAH